MDKASAFFEDDSGLIAPTSNKEVGEYGVEDEEEWIEYEEEPEEYIIYEDDYGEEYIVYEDENGEEIIDDDEYFEEGEDTIDSAELAWREYQKLHCPDISVPSEESEAEKAWEEFQKRILQNSGFKENKEATKEEPEENEEEAFPEEYYEQLYSNTRENEKFLKRTGSVDALELNEVRWNQIKSYEDSITKKMNRMSVTSLVLEGMLKDLAGNPGLVSSYFPKLDDSSSGSNRGSGILRNKLEGIEINKRLSIRASPIKTKKKGSSVRFRLPSESERSLSQERQKQKKAKFEENKRKFRAKEKQRVDAFSNSGLIELALEIQNSKKDISDIAPEERTKIERTIKLIEEFKKDKETMEQEEAQLRQLKKQLMEAQKKEESKEPEKTKVPTAQGQQYDKKKNMIAGWKKRDEKRGHKTNEPQTEANVSEEGKQNSEDSEVKPLAGSAEVAPESVQKEEEKKVAEKTEEKKEEKEEKDVEGKKLSEGKKEEKEKKVEEKLESEGKKKEEEDSDEDEDEDEDEDDIPVNKFSNIKIDGNAHSKIPKKVEPTGHMDPAASSKKTPPSVETEEKTGQEPVEEKATGRRDRKKQQEQTARGGEIQTEDRNLRRRLDKESEEDVEVPKKKMSRRPAPNESTRLVNNAHSSSSSGMCGACVLF
eukprot:CAMPEP_0174252848 /NCGR_PEP_ID=MMETSP0439-20130205/2212_1 /TAXON_ID=0 /ORGANISM="Stereomyxa ramosa, Strain Chinc5" /LENGTH=653 /DNA_ID=CAMNT_0015333499 /DNA_START=61 /DNA_END=2022 /DNA_ORIENTATION=-